MLEKELINYGLDEKEAKLYLALLELGEANVATIALKSGIKRTSVYHLLESLREKGVVSSVKRQKKTYYYAQNPKKLESKLEERQMALKKAMPELLSLANMMDKKPKIEYFEGFEGIKSILNDELSYHDREMCGWITEGYLGVLGEEYFNTYFNPKRKENNIFFRIITPVSEHFERIEINSQQKLRQQKIVSDKEFIIESDIVLYGKAKISIVSYKENMGMIITSSKLFNTLKAIFDLNWKMLQ